METSNEQIYKMRESLQAKLIEEEATAEELTMMLLTDLRLQTQMLINNSEKTNELLESMVDSLELIAGATHNRI